MIFTNPAFLWALLLALIPIIIHFFNFQRPKKVFFSQVQFLKEATQTATSRNRLKHLLVLAARTLFITALVLAFAQPIIPKNQTKEAQTAYSDLVSLYVDNSFSLENETDNKRNLDLALAYADQIATLFPAQTRFQLLENSLQGSRFDFYEADKLKEKLGVLDFSPTQTDISTLAAKQKQALLQEAAGQKARIFWISDFQKSQHRSLERIDTWANHLDTTSQYFVLPLTPTENKNVFVDSIWLETPFVQLGQNNRLWVRLRNTGKEALEKQNLTLLIDDKQSASAQFDLLPEATTEISLAFLPEKNGALAAKVRIEDYPITFDNDYHFVLEVAPLVRIVAITNEKNTANSTNLATYFEKVYQGVPLFSFQNMNQDLLDYEILQKADLLILAGISEIDAALNSILINFLNKGGSLALFPTAKMDLEGFHRALGLNLERLPAATASGENLPALWIGLETPNPNLPFFQGVFEKVSAEMSLPEAAPTYKWRNAGLDLLKFRNGLPFLSQFNRQNGGNLFVFAAPLEEGFSNLAKHALFVPVMFRMALTSKNKTNRLAYSFSDTYAELELDSLKKEDIFRLKNASDNTLQIIPAQRLVAQKLWLEVPKIGLPAGVYWVENNRDSTQKNTENVIKLAIAFNYSKGESETSYYTAEELKALFEPYPFIKVLENTGVERFAADYRKENEALPLWRYFIYAALLLLLIETLLIRFWK